MKLISTDMIKLMLKSSANNLMNKKQIINDLNVFPVPDGDTGTNMSMTFCSSVDMTELDKMDTIDEIFNGLSKAALRCARGNSGVILSQIIRGFANGIEPKSEALDSRRIAIALDNARDTAYRAVMKVTEGTILTVLREMAEFADKNYKKYDNNVKEFINIVLEHGKAALDNTRETLEILKRAGVVDAGGAGLIAIFEGAVYALQNNSVIELENLEEVSKKTTVKATEDIRYTYCTEFLINKSSDRQVNTFIAAIDAKGDCMLVIDDEEIVKVHIHTDHPGFVIEEALKLGELTNLKIDNMRYQHNEIINSTENSDAKTKSENENKDMNVNMGTNANTNMGSEAASTEKKKYAVVAVVMGDGFKEIFKELKADAIVDGGQTMNPSTEDLLSAANSVNAETVFILPNNKNIIMAANQVKGLTDCRVEVIPSRNVAQGISALMGFEEDSRTEDNIESMKDMMDIVRYGQITTAVRDAEFENMTVKCGDIIGICGDEIIEVGNDINSVALNFIEKTVDKYSSSISIYYGAEVEKEKAEELLKAAEEKYPSLDVMLIYGGQPVYYYGIAVEGA